MDRERFEELLNDYADGRLEGADREAFERALEENPTLRAELDADREILAMLRDLPRPKAPATLRARIMDRVREEMTVEAAAVRAPAASAPRRRGFWAWIGNTVPSRPAQVALAACALGAVVLVTAILPRTLTFGPTEASRRAAMPASLDKADRPAEPAELDRIRVAESRDEDLAKGVDVSDRMAAAEKESKAVAEALAAPKAPEAESRGERMDVLASAAGGASVLEPAEAAPSPSPARFFAEIPKEETQAEAIAIAELPAAAASPLRVETRPANEEEAPEPHEAEEPALTEAAPSVAVADLSGAAGKPQPPAKRDERRLTAALAGELAEDRDRVRPYGGFEGEDRVLADARAYAGASKEKMPSKEEIEPVATEGAETSLFLQGAPLPSSPTVAIGPPSEETGQRPMSVAFSAEKRMAPLEPVQAKRTAAPKAGAVDTVQAGRVLSMDLYLQASRVIADARRSLARRDVSGEIPGLTPGIAPSGAVRRVAPAPLSLDGLERELRSMGFATRYDEGKSTLFCSIRGRDAQWATASLARIGVKVASLTRGDRYLAISERDSLAEARHIFKNNPQQKGFAAVTGYSDRKAMAGTAISRGEGDVPLVVQIRVRYLNVNGASD